MAGEKNNQKETEPFVRRLSEIYHLLAAPRVYITLLLSSESISVIKAEVPIPKLNEDEELQEYKKGDLKKIHKHKFGKIEYVG